METMFYGTLYMRKARGRKLHFMVMGGFESVAQIQNAIRWEVSKGFVFEFHGVQGPVDGQFNPDEAAPFSLVPVKE